MTWQETLFVGLVIAVAGWLFKVIYDYRKLIYICIKRQKLKFFPVNFNIALSLEFKEGLNSGNYYLEIRKNLIKALEEVGMEKLVKIVDFSDIQKFKNKEQAEKFRNKKNIDLIIWGDFSTDSLKKGGEAVNKLNLNFTYGHPNDKEGKLGVMLLSDIRSKFAQKNYWQIFENNSLEDIKIISENLFDLAVYVMALTLKIYGKIGKSTVLFEKLHDRLMIKQDIFIQNVVFHLLNCYELMIIELGVNRKQLQEGIKYCRKFLNLKENDFFALSNLAVFQFKIGEKDNSENTVNKLLEIYPNIPLTEVNVAFMRVLAGRYKNAYNHYEKLFKYQLNQLGFNPLDIIEFLTEQYNKTREPGLLYGSGMVAHHFCDPKIAKEDLRLFLKKSSDSGYKTMRRKAKNTLREI